MDPLLREKTIRNKEVGKGDGRKREMENGREKEMELYPTFLAKITPLLRYLLHNINPKRLISFIVLALLINCHNCELF